MKPLPVRAMFNPLFPQRADNTYRAYKLALWLFVLVVLLKFGVGLNSIFNGHFMASSGDGIPLDRFTPAGAQTVVALVALWGLVHLMICLLCVLVLVRYRTLIPCMFALLLLEHLGRILVLYLLPIAHTGLGGGTVGISPFPYLFLVMIIIGLALSLRSPVKPQTQE